MREFDVVVIGGGPAGSMCGCQLKKAGKSCLLVDYASFPRDKICGGGLSAKSFDGRGNYNMGVREQIIFPEIEYDKIDALRGLNITITTTAKTDEEARALLSLFKFPFKG